MKGEYYLCCDLKSFYASAECMERRPDSMTTNLVMADKRRTDKAICLAIVPSLRTCGISGRTGLFEVVQEVEEVNPRRQRQVPGRRFTGAFWHDRSVQENPSSTLDYLTAPPRMAHYTDWSTKTYRVYLRYIAPESISPYSIDEMFIDMTNYLDTCRITARELTQTILLDILSTTDITAAAGVGSNLHLAKTAMDIVSKHIRVDRHGVRIAKPTEEGYRRLFWTHRPLMDFWRVGRDYTGRLEANGLYAIGNITRCSIGKPTDYHNEGLLYKLFGVNVEILIGHAWGWEPCTIADVKAYKPGNKNVVSGQVPQYPYDFDKARLVMRRMTDAPALELVDKDLMTNQLAFTVGYDRENPDNPGRRQSYHDSVTIDRYGWSIPRHAVGTENFPYTSSANDLQKAATTLYDRIADENLLIHRLSISANKPLDETKTPNGHEAEQMDLFTDHSAREQQEQADEAAHARERKLQEAMLGIKKRYGRSTILKGMNLKDGATAEERNQTIGGRRT